MPQLDFFLLDQHLGTAQASIPWSYQPVHVAYFCRSCGQVWGRVLVGGAQKWDMSYRLCPRCPAWDEGSRDIGSFTSEYHHIIPGKEWPISVLSHELLALLKQTESTL